MLRRLLLLLLVLGLSPPAVAMTGHSAPAAVVATAHGCHEQAPSRKDAAPAQVRTDCIGCAVAWQAEPILLTSPLLAVPDHEQLEGFALPAAMTTPETPPPRT